jgi:hypothetical protein
MSKSELWPADNPAVIAHIAMLQAIITRLATASASCKTWCLALVGALLSFSAGMDSPGLAAFAIMPIVIFAFLDANYLAQERAYRDLFATVSTRIRDGSYALGDTFEARAPAKRWAVLKAYGSWSIWPIYLSLLLAYGVAMRTGWIAAPPATPAAQSPPAAPAH